MAIIQQYYKATNMEQSGINSFLDQARTILWTWVSAIFGFVILIFLFLSSSLLAEFFRISESAIVIVFAFIYTVIQSISGYFICKHDPKSVWYVPFLSNASTLLFFLLGLDMLSWLAMIGLPIISCFWGTMKGRKDFW